MDTQNNKLQTGFLVVIAATILAVWPFLSSPSLPTGTDAEIHIFRAAQVEKSITEGILYPRWAPDFYYGNGYPIFNYYAPLAYHLAAYYSLLTGFGVVAGSKFVLILAAFLGSVGMYMFVAKRWGRVEAMVAGVAWCYSPYIIFLEPHARGEIAESLAIGISPLVLWLFDQVRNTGHKYHIVLAALSLAAVILSHPLTALVTYGFLIIFLLWEFLITPLTLDDSSKSINGSTVYSVTIAVILGLGLASLYWLPAGFEREIVRMDYYGIGHYDFRRHFIELSELISPAIWSDTGAAFPVFNFSMGSVHVVLAIMGVATVFNRHMRRLDTLLMTLGLFGATYLMTDASQGLWEMIPPMRYFQFPMRFLGSAALAIVPLCGLSMAWVKNVKNDFVKNVIPSVVVGLILFSSFPLMYPPEWGDFGEVNGQRYHRDELQGKWFGTTCCHDFVPVDVQLIPDPDPYITEQYLDNRVYIEKFDRRSLPSGTVIEVVSSNSESDIYYVSSDNEFALRMSRFYFPGWKVIIDDEEWPFEISDPHGRIVINMPAGEYQLKLSFEATPIRSVSNLISLFSLVVTIVVLLFGFRDTNVYETSENEGSPITYQLALLVVLAAMVIKYIGGVGGWFQYHSVGRNVHVADYNTFAVVEDELELLAYDISASEVYQGDELSLVLYWKANVAPTRNYQVYVHLRSEDGTIVGQSDKINPASYPTSRWGTGKYVADNHTISVSENASTGLYQFHVGLWDHLTGERFLAFDVNGWLLGESIPIDHSVYVTE